MNLNVHKAVIWTAFALFIAIVFSIRLDLDTKGMNDSGSSVLKETGQQFQSRFRVIDDPQTYNFMTQIIAKDLGLNKKVIVKSTSSSQQQLASLKYGDVISYEGYITELDFYQKYRKREHVVGSVNVTRIFNHEHKTNFIERSVEALRNRVEIGCSRLSPEQKGICEGLIIGERGAISNETYSTFKEAQLTHLLVASGANIALMLSFLSPLIAKFRLTNRNLIMMGVAIFYCMLVRFEPSMIRASVMVIIPSAFEIRGYKISKVKVFVSTIISCAILDPFLVFRVGFWLSASAVFGLLFIAPKFKTFIKSSIFCDTMGASLMTQPVLWIVFGFIVPGKWWSSVPGVALAGPLTTFGCSLVFLISFIHPESIISQVSATGLGAGIDCLMAVARIGAQSWSFTIGIFMLLFLIIAYTRSNVSKPSFLYRRRRSNIEIRRTF